MVYSSEGHFIEIPPPVAYRPGYEKARRLDAELADTYVENTMVGDPLWDAAVASLADFDHAKTHELINACMEQDEKLMSSAPQELRDFFGALENPPLNPRFDPQKSIAGCRAFHRNSDMFFVGLVLDSAISGFTTGVSKSFYLTGRTAGNLRRLKQNTRHLVEITLPGGLERYGDGWKLTARIRLIHAQMQQSIIQTVDSDAVKEAQN